MRTFRVLILIALILAASLAAFLPCLNNGFVNWDDDAFVTKNAAVRSLSIGNIGKIFTTYFYEYYCPATILAYLVEYQLFKLDPFGYHLINLILHLINCLLIFWLISLLGGSAFVAFLTAILFGVHPVCVESVAWISDMKDLLYTCFFLGSIICYLKYVRENGKLKYYIFSAILFTISLLCKPMAMILPLALFLLDYFLHKKLDRRNFINKIPFLALSLIFLVIASNGPGHNEYSLGSLSQGLFDRIILASYGIMFYLGKIFAPVKLSCLYPFDGMENIRWPLLYPSAVIALSAAVLFSRKYTRKLVFGAAFFLIGVLPNLQLIPFHCETLVADRYVYIASIGIFYILAEMFARAYAWPGRHSRIAKIAICVILISILVTLIFLTRQRCAVWKDSVTLWADVVKNYPDCTTAYDHRGRAFFERGEYDKAKADWARMIHPASKYYRRNKEEGFVGYNQNLSALYHAQGLHQKAIALLEEAIKKDPKHKYGYYINLAVSYSKTGKMKEAIALYEELISKKINEGEACYNLGILYESAGDHEKAVYYHKMALEINPGLDVSKEYTK